MPAGGWTVAAVLGVGADVENAPAAASAPPAPTAAVDACHDDVASAMAVAASAVDRAAASRVALDLHVFTAAASTMGSMDKERPDFRHQVAAAEAAFALAVSAARDAAKFAAAAHSAAACQAVVGARSASVKEYLPHAAALLSDIHAMQGSQRRAVAAQEQAAKLQAMLAAMAGGGAGSALPSSANGDGV
jgi:hypothetical protein